MATETRHPEIEVDLSGEDGNAFAIIDRTTKALRRGGVPRDEIDAFRAELTMLTEIRMKVG